MNLKKHSFILFAAINFLMCQLHAQAPALSNTIYNGRDTNTLFAYKPLFNGTDRSVMTTKKFNIALTDCGRYSSFPMATGIATSKYYGLADSYNSDYWTGYREWGYDIHRDLNNDGYGPNETYGYQSIPTSPTDAYTTLSQIYLRNTTGYDPSGGHTPVAGEHYYLALTGHMFYQHYAAAWDKNVDIIGIETGENISSIPANIAFCRGASRQYNRFMGVDFSPWWGGIKDYTPSWYRADTAITSYQVYGCSNGGRIGVLRKDGTLSVKEGTIDARYFDTTVNVASFCMDSTRVAYISTGGVLFVRDGLGTSWVQMATGAASVALTDASAGNRIGYIDNSAKKSLHMHQGALSSTAWTLVADSVTQFQLEGSNIGIVQTNNQLAIKVGDYVSQNWYTGVDLNVSKFQLKGTRIASLEKNGNFNVKDGWPSNNWAILDKNVTAFHLNGTRIAKIDKDSILSFQDGSLSENWAVIAAHATDVKLWGTRIAVVKDSGALSLVDGSLVNGALSSAWLQLFALQSDFQLYGNVISTLWPTGKLFVKDGGLQDPQPGTARPWGGDSHPITGHSISLEKRTFYNANMGGASIYYPEAGSVDYFQTPETLNGKYILSPRGVAGRDFYKFSHTTLTNRGIPWTPVGIMLNTAHGLGLVSFYQPPGADQTYGTAGRIFGGALNMGSKDSMNLQLLSSIWTNSLIYECCTGTREDRYTETGKYGEIFDVLTDSASSAVISKYPIIILSGDIDTLRTNPLTKKLTDYVKAGGNLVLNVSYLNDTLQKFAGVYKSGRLNNLAFDNLQWTGDAGGTGVNFKADLETTQSTIGDSAKSLMAGGPWKSGLSYNLAWIKKIGLGNVITVGFPDLKDTTVWKFIIGNLTKSAAIKPFTVSPGVQYMFNTNPNEWLITLTNNAGESKNAYTSDNIDLTQHKLITVTLQDPNVAISAVTDVISGQSISASNGSFSVDVPAADVKVIRVSTAKATTRTSKNEKSPFKSTGQDFMKSQEVFVYPNPIVNVAKLSKVFSNVVVYDLNGKLVTELKNVSSINFQNVAHGTYVIKLTDANGAQKNIEVVK